MQPGQRNSNIEELLRKLRTGSLTELEWAELQRAAADDPFLQDALEGLRTTPSEARARHLQSLAHRLRVSTAPKSRRLFTWPRLAGAAAVLLLLVGGWVVWQNTQAPTSSVALFDEQTLNGTGPDESGPPPSDATEAETVTREEVAEKETTPPASSAPALTTRANDQPAREEPLRVVDGVPVTERDRAAPGQAAAVQSESTSNLVGSNRTASTLPAADNPESTQEEHAANRLARENRANVNDQITGSVQDHTGEPLIGANIQLKGTAQNAISDMAGYFMIEVPSETAPASDLATLVVSYVGYEPLEAEAGPGDSLVLQLTEQAANLSEVQVTGYQSGARKQRDDDRRSESRALARPSDGDRRYQRYLRQNLQIPAEARAQGISGTVVLEFNVLPNGRPDSIRVVQSLGFGCDAEAIRLIQEGPDWDVASAQVPVGRVSVKF